MSFATGISEAACYWQLFTVVVKSDMLTFIKMPPTTWHLANSPSITSPARSISTLHLHTLITRLFCPLSGGRCSQLLFSPCVFLRMWTSCAWHHLCQLSHFPSAHCTWAERPLASVCLCHSPPLFTFKLFTLQPCLGLLLGPVWTQNISQVIWTLLSVGHY